ncbi:alpha/beta hydrolase [Saccharothrix variisporea]|uniref:Alpha-beta hydrolase superfamily lysophospholipase n=1 Tax=Saccharothrix variisporea TaxID=543527 RepID=A0A495X969_9PSEU|nr:alpha/beta fold hydrolase [Saccharothrix variisporea]RKT69153.1 alpha-beta hydrolase superfamily lysophospholipase [Saccharothrix variisporea]
MRPDTIVLIHGMHLTPLAWEGWVHRYTAAGYRVLAPAWPGLEVGVAALRGDPTPLAEQTVAGVVDHYARIIAELDRPPIVVGHCYGGTFTQLLLDRGLGAAGVALGTAPTRGMTWLPWSTIRTHLPALRHRTPVMPTYAQMRYTLTNTMPEDEAAAVYRRHTIPPAPRLVLDRALAELTPKSPYAVRYHRPDRPPLLFVAGTEDNQSPPSVVRANARRYHRAGLPADYLEFPGRCHFSLGQEGWTDIADAILDWARARTA